MSPTSTSIRSTFPIAPTQGTQVGYHQYDAQLEDYSSQQPSMPRSPRCRSSRSASRRCSAKAAFDLTTRGDREMVLGNIRSQLLTLETIRPWEKNPDIYSSTARQRRIRADGAQICSRPTIGCARWLRAKSRCRRLLDEARANLKNPPHIYTEIAIEQLPGIVSFFRARCARGLRRRARIPRSRKSSRTPTPQVIAALKSYLDWLKTDLLAALQRRLPHRRGHVLEEARIRRDGRSAARQAARNRLGRSAQESGALQPGREGTRAGQGPAAPCSKSWARMHPAPDHLLDTFRATFDSLIGFIRAHHIVTIPSDVRPIVEETPPFMRATTFASHGHAGPLREARHRGLFQRHAARSLHDAGGGRGLHALVQHRHRHLDRGARGLSRPLRAVPVGAAGAQPRAQAAGRQHQRRRLGPLLRADDARRRLRPARRRARKTSANRNSCALASCRMRCCATRASSSASKCIPAR